MSTRIIQCFSKNVLKQAWYIICFFPLCLSCGPRLSCSVHLFPFVLTLSWPHAFSVFSRPLVFHVLSLNFIRWDVPYQHTTLDGPDVHFTERHCVETSLLSVHFNHLNSALPPHNSIEANWRGIYGEDAKGSYLMRNIKYQQSNDTNTKKHCASLTQCITFFCAVLFGWS